MRILITNAFLGERTGSECFCEELAMDLRARGHTVGLFSPVLGRIAAVLRDAGFVVVDDPSSLPWTPDVIHGQHQAPSDLAAAAFPRTPMFVLCHGAIPAEEALCRAPNVACFAAVDLPSRDRVARETGVAAESIHLLFNSINLARFHSRAPLPPHPLRALVFSNYVRDSERLNPLRAVCAEAGVELHTIGRAMTYYADAPWDVLPDYDVVFAKARCALEAMACGCAVVLCDVQGVGPMVDSRNFEGLRLLNFGYTALNAPHDARVIRSRLDRYDPADAARVSARVRAEADWTRSVDWLEATYARLAASPVAAIQALPPAPEKKSIAPPPVPAARAAKFQPGPVERIGVAAARNVRRIISKPRPPAPMPFIVGVFRSGTTLLRMMLDAHPQMAILPETGFISAVTNLDGEGALVREWFFRRVVDFPMRHPHWIDYHIDARQFRRALLAVEPFTIAGGLRCFYRLYAARFKKSRWGDKTPMYATMMSPIEELLPEARFIHILRDGRDSAASVRHLPFAPAGDIAGIAAHWVRQVETARVQGRLVRHYMEVRFEDLLRDRCAVMRRVCDFLDLPWDDAIARYHETAPARLREHEEIRSDAGDLMVAKDVRYERQRRSVALPDPARIGFWKDDFSDRDRILFESVAGHLLEQCGYPL